MCIVLIRRIFHLPSIKKFNVFHGHIAKHFVMRSYVFWLYVDFVYFSLYRSIYLLFTVINNSIFMTLIVRYFAIVSDTALNTFAAHWWKYFISEIWVEITRNKRMLKSSTISFCGFIPMFHFGSVVIFIVFHFIHCRWEFGCARTITCYSSKYNL